jgi:hypothetical protein
MPIINVIGDVSGSGDLVIDTRLTDTGVTPGIYGNSTSVPQIAVDSKGRITGVILKTVVAPKGPAGPQGAQGLEGPVGPMGPQGYRGPTGDRGDLGPAGPQGIQGPVGPKGDVGPTGPQGIQGPAGVRGPAGSSEIVDAAQAAAIQSASSATLAEQRAAAALASAESALLSAELATQKAAIAVAQAEAAAIAASQSSDKFYVHDQTSAEDTWNVQHNLNKFPAVSITDSAGDQVEGEVQYVGANLLLVKFSAPFAGRAYIN